MKVEINVTYAKSLKVEVPEELAPDKDWNYPDREKFDEWCAEQLNFLRESDLPPDIITGEVFETEQYNSLYDEEYL